MSVSCITDTVVPTDLLKRVFKAPISTEVLETITENQLNRTDDLDGFDIDPAEFRSFVVMLQSKILDMPEDKNTVVADKRRESVREDTEQVPNSPIKASRTPVPPVQTMVSTNTDVAIVEQNAYVPSNEVITVRDITFEMSGADDKQKNSCDVQNLVEFDNIDDIINAFPEDNNIDLEQFGDVATTVYPMDWFNMPDEVQCAMDSGDTFPNDVDKALSTEQIQSDEIEDVVLDNSMLDEIKDVLNENVFDIMDITTSDIDSIPENKTTPTSRKRKQMDTSNGISVVIEETSNTGKEQEKVVTVISSDGTETSPSKKKT